MKSFNPYSPGFSIYLDYYENLIEYKEGFNPYSPGFSIYLKNKQYEDKTNGGFNPYSPGFSIYLLSRRNGNTGYCKASILIHLDFLSISRQ